MTNTTTQGSDIAASVITISGLDIDGVGGNDDQIGVVFAVSATGGDLARLSQGYRLDPGYALTFSITSLAVSLGGGGGGYTASTIGFVSTSVNNVQPYTVTSPEAGFTTLTGVSGTQSLIADAGIDGLSGFTMESTGTANNCARNIVAKFNVFEVTDPVAPVAINDIYNMAYNTTFTNPAPGVLVNDTDTNMDSLTAILVNLPTNGTLLSFSANGAFIYQPDPG